MKLLPEWIREMNEYERRAPARPVRVEPVAPTAPAAPHRRNTSAHASARAAAKRRRQRRFRRTVGWLLVMALLGSVLGVALHWSVQDDAVPLRVRAYALAHGYDVSEWPQKLLALYDRNEEARDFVLHYPARQERQNDYAVTFDGTVPLYLQWDERWGYESYNGDLLALTGCGPCCLAMAATYLTGDAMYDPLWMSRWAEDEGYAVAGVGTSWTLFSEGAETLGLDAVEIGADEQRVADNLAVGNLVVCVMGPGDFTTEGHFILLTGYDGGYVTVHDPNSIERSESLWRFADISDQMRALWVLRTAA